MLGYPQDINAAMDNLEYLEFQVIILVPWLVDIVVSLSHYNIVFLSWKLGSLLLKQEKLVLRQEASRLV